MVSKPTGHRHPLGGLNTDSWVLAPNIMIAVKQGQGPRICLLKLPGGSNDGKHCVCTKKQLELDQIVEGFKDHAKSPLFPQTMPGTP